MFLEAQPRLTFGVKAAAYGCGISVRQLDWWTRVGYVPVLQNGRHRRYSANAIKIALLINYGLSQGMSLRRSTEQARKRYPFLWENAAAPPQMEEAPVPPEEDLATIRREVVRLTAEMAEIGKRLSLILGTTEDAAPTEIDEEDE
jgi:DNA-binding transcriptional MerR regulator